MCLLNHTIVPVHIIFLLIFMPFSSSWQMSVGPLILVVHTEFMMGRTALIDVLSFLWYQWVKCKWCYSVCVCARFAGADVMKDGNNHYSSPHHCQVGLVWQNWWCNMLKTLPCNKDYCSGFGVRLSCHNHYRSDFCTCCKHYLSDFGVRYEYYRLLQQ